MYLRDMCGRFALTASDEELVAAIGMRLPLPPRSSRPSVSPGQEILAVRSAPEGARADLLPWGVPRATREGRRFLRFNARAETLLRGAAHGLRSCVIPADGFYEWRDGPAGRGPVFLRRRDHRPLAMAAILEVGAGPEAVEASCIITVQANGDVAPVHGRMPVLLAPEDCREWLRQEDGRLDPRFLVPAHDGLLEVVEVDPAIFARHDVAGRGPGRGSRSAARSDARRSTRSGGDPGASPQTTLPL